MLVVMVWPAGVWSAQQQAEKIALSNKFLFVCQLLNVYRIRYWNYPLCMGWTQRALLNRSLTVSRDGSGQVFLVGGTELASNRLASIIFQI